MIIFKYEITRSEVYRRVRQCEKIKEISIEQADSMEQVEATEERIAEVVQNNSDVAQETSATSEELTAQATCIFRKNRALAPHERSAVPLGTDHCPVG